MTFLEEIDELLEQECSSIGEQVILLDYAIDLIADFSGRTLEKACPGITDKTARLLELRALLAKHGGTTTQA